MSIAQHSQPATRTEMKMNKKRKKHRMNIHKTPVAFSLNVASVYSNFVSFCIFQQNWNSFIQCSFGIRMAQTLFYFSHIQNKKKNYLYFLQCFEMNEQNKKYTNRT